MEAWYLKHPTLIKMLSLLSFVLSLIFCFWSDALVRHLNDASSESLFHISDSYLGGMNYCFLAAASAPGFIGLRGPYSRLSKISLGILATAFLYHAFYVGIAEL